MSGKEFYPAGINPEDAGPRVGPPPEQSAPSGRDIAAQLMGLSPGEAPSEPEAPVARVPGMAAPSMPSSGAGAQGMPAPSMHSGPSPAPGAGTGSPVGGPLDRSVSVIGKPVTRDQVRTSRVDVKWRPAPRPSARIVPVAVSSGGLAIAGYLWLVVGTMPLAGLAALLGVVAGAFCWVMLHE